MNSLIGYRKEVSTAIKFFRPILAALNIRNPEKQDIVYLAEFDHLDFLSLDNCIVTVLCADLKTSPGMFFCRQEGEYTHCYIVIQNALYKKSLEYVKFVGVHEFCHFMAIVYSITSTSIEKQREFLLNRLKTKVDELSLDSLNKFIMALDAKENVDNLPDFADEHFRLNCEGDTISYALLFRHFMLSKELFEEYFTETDRYNFKLLVKSDNDSETDEALRIYTNKISAVEKEKSIMHKLAWNQALSWVKDYLI